MIYGDKEYSEGEIKQPDIQAIMQNGNLYVYCMNNPVKFVDLNGCNVYVVSISFGAELGLSFSSSGAIVFDDGVILFSCFKKFNR